MKVGLSSSFIPRKVFFLCIVLVCTVAFFAGSLAILVRFKPVFEEKASNAAKMKATDIINKATDSVFADIYFENPVNITKDEEGKITSVHSDSVAMNQLKTKLSLAVQQFAENAEDSTVYIPIGSLTSFSVLQGVGYRIPVKLSTDGFAKIDFNDEFINAGINQVKHKIYMTASVKVSVISSVMSKTETVTAEIPVAETVIVGTVPNYYGDNLSVVGR